MVLGVGVDIIGISRMKDAIETGGRVFLDKTFTAAEQEQAATRGDPYSHYAMIFAGKEAIFKSLTTSWETGVRFTEISIGFGKNGEPVPTLTGKFAEVLSRRGAKNILLSLSYDAGCAVAMAILT